MNSPIRSGLTLLGLLVIMMIIILNPRTVNQESPLRSIRDNRMMPRNSMRRLREDRIRD